MNERGEVTNNTYEIRRIIRNFYQQIYANKLNNVEKMVAFLETYKLPRLKQEETDFLNILISDEEIKVVIKNLPKIKSPGPERFPGECYQTFKEEKNTYSPEAVSKNRNRRTTTKLILWGQYYLDPQTRQRPHQKGELQTNIPDEYGCQNSQQGPC